VEDYYAYHGIAAGGGGNSVDTQSAPGPRRPHESASLIIHGISPVITAPASSAWEPMGAPDLMPPASAIPRWPSQVSFRGLQVRDAVWEPFRQLSFSTCWPRAPSRAAFERYRAVDSFASDSRNTTTPFLP